MAVILLTVSLMMHLACTSTVQLGFACFVDLCLMKVTTHRGFNLYLSKGL